MKSFSYIWLVVLMVSNLSLASCSDDDNMPQGAAEMPDVSDVQVEVTDSTTLTANELADLVYGAEGSNMSEERQAMRKEFLERCEKEADAYAAQTGQNGLATLFRYVTYNYWSDDENGRGIKLSAMVMWGQFGIKVFGKTLATDLDPDNIYLMEWYDEIEITDKSTAPSLDWGIAHSVFHDNLVIMPDHIGFGVSEAKAYPFLMNDVNAKNSIDALKAGLKVFHECKQSGTKLEDDWKFYVLGCGVGGGNALAVHKYMDTHSDFASSWRFDYSFIGSGPYCPAASMDRYLEKKKVLHRAYFPLLLKSMIANYPDIMGKWKEEDFYTEEYLKIKPQIDKMLEEKSNNLEEISETIKSLLGIDNESYYTGGEALDRILNATALDKNSEMMQALYKCLDKCDLTNGWTPSHRIKVYHGNTTLFTLDEAEALEKAFGDKVTLFEKTSLSKSEDFFRKISQGSW